MPAYELHNLTTCKAAVPDIISLFLVTGPALWPCGSDELLIET